MRNLICNEILLTSGGGCLVSCYSHIPGNIHGSLEGVIHMPQVPFAQCNPSSSPPPSWMSSGGPQFCASNLFKCSQNNCIATAWTTDSSYGYLLDEPYY